MTDEEDKFIEDIKERFSEQFKEGLRFGREESKSLISAYQSEVGKLKLEAALIQEGEIRWT